ncbi:MAG: monovalent cation/H(+) antiporter subunit G [Pseudomonadota bacterium]
MLETLLEILAALALIAGGLLCFAAGLGIVRFQDVYLRMHAATKAGTLGLIFIALALCIAAPGLEIVVKSILVSVFMIITAPVGSHLIGRAAFRTGAPIWQGTDIDTNCESFREGAAEASRMAEED